MWYRYLLFPLASLLLGWAWFSAGETKTPLSSSPSVPIISPELLSTAEHEAVDFLVILADQADLSQASLMPDRAARGSYVMTRLQQTAASSQAGILAALNQQGIPHRTYWIVNMLWVKGDLAVVSWLAAQPGVVKIVPNTAFNSLPIDENNVERTPSAIEWGVSKIGAPTAWAAGYMGQGAVVAGQDTGYEWDHPGLIAQYRGWNGASANHNYNWHDAIHELENSGTNPCGLDSVVPCDDNSHGTHTAGTMVGDDGGSNQVGVAPEAAWIGCRNMERGWGTPVTYAECYQWFIAPTDLNGANPDPAKAPHVINNSWACPAIEGCIDASMLYTITNNVRSAGIMTVHSAGNSGSSCETIDTPSAIYDASFTVGATDANDIIAGFSSRGPVTVDGSQRLKPDVSAPGVSVRSTVLNGSYGTKSGTSMAGPHVAGVVAILLSARPDLAGDVDALEAILRESALPRTSAQTCGGVSGGSIPNNTYGYGRIDVVDALELALAPVVTLTVTPGDPDLMFSWLTHADNCEYVVHRQQAPYFDIDETTAVYTTTLGAYTDTGVLAPDESYFYQLEADHCSGMLKPLSSQTGALSFGLQPGEAEATTPDAE